MAKRRGHETRQGAGKGHSNSGASVATFLRWRAAPCTNQDAAWRGVEWRAGVSGGWCSVVSECMLPFTGRARCSVAANIPGDNVRTPLNAAPPLRVGVQTTRPNCCTTPSSCGGPNHLKYFVPGVQITLHILYPESKSLFIFCTGRAQIFVQKLYKKCVQKFCTHSEVATFALDSFPFSRHLVLL